MGSKIIYVVPIPLFLFVTATKCVCRADCERSMRDNGGWYYWCYLVDGKTAKSCLGAIKSNDGDYYWSDHADNCGGRYTQFDMFIWLL